jgi:hypothetical protein
MHSNGLDCPKRVSNTFKMVSTAFRRVSNAFKWLEMHLNGLKCI